MNFSDLLGPALKDFALNWLLPPGFVAARRRKLIPDFQKFWAGASVPAPSFEANFFKRADLACETITRRDDSRPCARILHEGRLPLPPGSQGEAVQLAVAAVRPWHTESRFTVTVGKERITHIGLSPDQWLDIRVDVPVGATHLDVVSDEEVYLSCPRPVRVNAVAQGQLRHVIVLVLDGWTTRVSAECHPTERGIPLTPNIDRFFVDAFGSGNGYASGEWTMPAAASLFTGLCTARHRIFHPTKKCQLPADRPLLAEIFQAAGFHTLAMSAAPRLSPAYGHHRGFDRFVYHFPEPGFTQVAYDPAVWIADLTGHLAVHQKDRTFSYVHVPDTHPPWHIPPLTRMFNLGRRGDSSGLDLKRLPEAGDPDQQGRQLYLLRLHEIDRLLGGLFEYIDRTMKDDTLVVLTADHGTPWHHLREKRPADEPYLVDDRTATSLQMRGPGIPHRRQDGLTSPNLDLMPTVLARAGLSAPDDLDGQDLLSPTYRRDHVISESLYRGVYEIAVRDGKRTYIEKYGLDEERVKIVGAPIYRGLFPCGTSDFTHSLSESPGVLADLAHAHLKKVGLVES